VGTTRLALPALELGGYDFIDSFAFENDGIITMSLIARSCTTSERSQVVSHSFAVPSTPQENNENIQPNAYLD
jgi:hypothetical protein